MKNRTWHGNNEGGYVIICVLMILVMVTILGVSSIRTSLTEQKIARNEMLYKETFYNGDSGPYTAAKLISKTIDDKAEQSVGPGGDFVDFAFRTRVTGDQAVTSQGAVFDQIMGFCDHDGGRKDLFFNNIFEVDIRRDQTVHIAGGSADFGAGAEGIGAGSKGGIAIYFQLDSDGLNAQTRPTNIIGIYRKVPDIIGGL